MSGEGKQLASFQQSVDQAQFFAQSDIIPVSYRNKPANVLVAAEFGKSMGLSTSESLYRINVIQGKPTMSAELIASQVRRAGHKYWFDKDAQHLRVTAYIRRCDDSDVVYSETMDAEWAHRMGLDKPDRNGNPSNYTKQPMTMLKWRALTAVAREACPEALYGMYAQEELRDEERAEQSRDRWNTSPVADDTVVTVMACHADIERLTGDLKQEWMHVTGLSGKDYNQRLKSLLGRDDVKPGNITQDEADKAITALREEITSLNQPNPEPEPEPETPEDETSNEDPKENTNE